MSDTVYRDVRDCIPRCQRLYKHGGRRRQIKSNGARRCVCPACLSRRTDGRTSRRAAAGEAAAPRRAEPGALSPARLGAVPGPAPARRRPTSHSRPPHRPTDVQLLNNKRANRCLSTSLPTCTHFVSGRYSLLLSCCCDEMRLFCAWRGSLADADILGKE